MRQTYHSNATTNVRLRVEISNSRLANLALSKKTGASKNTIKKWKSREVFEDKISRPHNIRYSL